ncbi:MAG TPA: serine/threonine-protein kinase [Candidatus Sulfotelmatobacter sp.]|nr:serine/threonine-protein kinase [Candidatus Sulfotelmatobacter sp.]
MENTRVSHYRVERLLGRGGMGEVYAGVDLTLGRPVALKFIAPGLVGDEETVRRFEREARSAAALNHPHIATLYAFEREGPRPFIAMELLSGRTLRHRMGAGPLAVHEALAIARDVAGALAFAHRRGVVHRDIKPENLMFSEHGAIKITDFGLARASQLTRLTTTGTTLGTASYMGPEAVRGESDAPADVFALGVVLFEMLAGETPWRSDNSLAMMYAIANTEPGRLNEHRADTPGAAVELVHRMLARDPAARPSSEAAHRELAALCGTPVRDAAADPATLDPEFENRPTVRVATDAPAVSGPGSLPALARTATEELEAEHVSPRPPAPAPAPPRSRRRVLGLRVELLIALIGFALLAGQVAYTRFRSARAAEEAARLNNQGLRALQAGRLSDARGYFETALRRDAPNSAARMNLGTIYRLLGNTAGAESLYFEALELARRQHRADLESGLYVNLADVEIDSEHWEGAVGFLRQAQAIDSSATVINNLGFALTLAGRPDEALAELRRGIERFPAQAMLFKNAALAELKLGHLDAAGDSVAKALVLEPTLAPALMLRAELRARQGDHEGAKEDWNSFLATKPDEKTRRQMADELTRLGVAVP